MITPVLDLREPCSSSAAGTLAVRVAGTHRADALSLLTMTQAFEAKPPPLVGDDDGVIRIAGTRVQLETVVLAFQAGATAEEIAQQYSSLNLADVYAVISYVLGN